MIRYLLGQLDPEEQAELDERAFVDDAWAEKVDLAADDLIDAYLSGGLTADARARFETHFLDSEARRTRFRFIRALRTVAARQTVRPSPAPARVATWAAAAALLLSTLAALFFYGRLEATLDQVALLEAQPTAPAPTVSVPGARPVPPGSSPRGAASPRTLTIAVPEPARAVAIAVGPELRTVTFAIPVPQAAAPHYSVTVSHEGQTVWQSEDLVPRGAGAPLEVGVPADVLANGAGVLSIEAGPARGASPDPHAASREWVLRIIRR